MWTNSPRFKDPLPVIWVGKPPRYTSLKICPRALFTDSSSSDRMGPETAHHGETIVTHPSERAWNSWAWSAVSPHGGCRAGIMQATRSESVSGLREVEFSVQVGTCRTSRSARVPGHPGRDGEPPRGPRVLPCTSSHSGAIPTSSSRPRVDSS